LLEDLLCTDPGKNDAASTAGDCASKQAADSPIPLVCLRSFCHVYVDILKWKAIGEYTKRISDQRNLRQVGRFLNPRYRIFEVFPFLFWKRRGSAIAKNPII
jgi:hypothetical protein